MTDRRTRYGVALIVLLGGFAFAALLAFHNITDGDLWGKLAIGSSVVEHGRLLRHDIFAFTPVLPEYIDHEWGAGVIFYALIKWFGPDSLMCLKIGLALSSLGCAFALARRNGADRNLLFLLAIPAAAAILPGYIPVLRCHAFTFALFGLTLLGLEALDKGARWPLAIVPLALLLWTNVHGGFVVGLAAIGIYAALAIYNRRQTGPMVGVALSTCTVTFVNPYGIKFWEYLIPALLHPRARIPEWRPLPLWGNDDFAGFRILFVLTVVAVLWGWKRVTRHNLAGLVVLAMTAYLGWRSRRHGPFFGVTALAFAGPYFAVVLNGWRASIRLTVIIYAGLALFMAAVKLPSASLQPLAPVGEDPVREADILSRAGVAGNLATPFAWGSYLTWRLFPGIKISMDGRYETTYPESTFDANANFYDRGPGWSSFLESNRVDFVILDLQERLQPEDLVARGYVLIWEQDKLSALLCRPEHAGALKEAVRTLPDFTIDPLRLVPWPK